jgi:proteasome lid subunit RPN8/RPN11
MRNAAASRRRYRVDDRDHIALRKALRRLTPPLSIVGVYHSHPDGLAAPSPSDVAQAFYPDWIQVIVGLRTTRPVLRAFRIRRGHVSVLRISAR